MTLQCAYSNLQYDKYAHTNHDKDSTNTKNESNIVTYAALRSSPRRTLASVPSSL